MEKVKHKKYVVVNILKVAFSLIFMLYLVLYRNH
jgi:hypothetical protein